MPDVVFENGLEVGVGEQDEGEIVLGRELRVLFNAVLADADDDDLALFEFGVEFREGLRLACASGGVVPRIEIKNDLASFEIRERDGFPVLVQQCEERGFITDVHVAFLFLLFHVS